MAVQPALAASAAFALATRSGPSQNGSQPRELQRAGHGASSREAPPLVHDVLRAPGSPLDASTRRAMQRRLGHDLGNVRVHTDERAAASARAVDALAYTVGSSIVFDSGRYAPHDSLGRELLTHELVHTIQQGLTEPGPAGEQLLVGPPDSAAESEARRISSETTPVTAAASSSPRLIARWTAPIVTLKDDEELIADAIAGDVTAMIEIGDYTKVKAADRISFIGQLLASGTLRTMHAVRLLWGTWSGEGFIRVASANLDLWKQSVALDSRIQDRPEIERIRVGFLGAVERTVSGYLTENRALVEADLLRYESPDGRAPTAVPGAEVANTQSLLAQVGDAQALLQGLRAISVGYVWSYSPLAPRDSDPMGGGERKMRQAVAFVPGQPPMQSGPSGDRDEPAMVPYDTVMAAHETLVGAIGALAQDNPAVYAIASRSQGDPQTARDIAQATPEAARSSIAEELHSVLRNIERTAAKLGEDSFLLKLGPVHRQVLAGSKFGDPLASWVIERELQAYKDSQFWIELGLTSIYAAAFIIGSLASGPVAVGMLATGLAVSAGGAASKVAEYHDLTAAKGSAVSTESEIVDQSAVDEQALVAAMAVAFAILDAATIAVKLVKPIVGLTINFAKRLSSEGLAGAGCVGVFETTHRGFAGKVVVKVFDTSTARLDGIFVHELEGARVAGTGENSAKFLGEVPVGKPGQRGYAMSRLKGGFIEPSELETMTKEELAAINESAERNAANVRDFTSKDLRAYGRRLLNDGYTQGEIQGFVGPDGHWRAMDFGRIRRIPSPATNPAEAAQMIRIFEAQIEGEARALDQAALKNRTP